MDAFITIAGNLLLIFALTSLVGGAVALSLGTLIVRNLSLTEVTLRVLSRALWLPFFIIWALPFWPNKRETALFWILAVGAAAVGLSACYHYLTARFILERSNRSKTRSYVLRETILQGLLISLIFSQVWVPGWASLVINKSGGIVVLTVMLLLLIGFLYLVDVVFQSAFDNTAKARSAILLWEISSGSWHSWWRTAVLVGVCLALWQLFSALSCDHFISSPIDVIDIGYLLLIGGTKIVQPGERLWADIAVSVAEVSLGVLLGCALAFLVSKALSSNAGLGNWVRALLPLTHIVPILLPLFWIYWGATVPSFRVALGLAFFPLQATTAVALLSFFPILRILWGMRHLPLCFRLPLAMDEALPFAFVAMLVSQAMGSVSGLGFFMLVARLHTHDIKEGVAAAVITIVLFTILSLSLRQLAKRVYFRAFGTAQLRVQPKPHVS